MCQFEMLFALLTFCFSSPKGKKKCYCFPTFKDLLAFTSHRFFKRSANVRADLLPPKFLSELFRLFWIDIHFFCEELTVFY